MLQITSAVYLLYLKIGTTKLSERQICYIFYLGFSFSFCHFQFPDYSDNFLLCPKLIGPHKVWKEMTIGPFDLMPWI